MNRDEEWQKLLEELTAELGCVGKNDAFGDGDYWIVDDDWGGHHQKICITRPSFFSKDFTSRVQELLKRRFPNWGVFVVFEGEYLTRTDKPSPRVIYANEVLDKPKWD
jgi:hypothetical protein